MSATMLLQPRLAPDPVHAELAHGLMVWLEEATSSRPGHCTSSHSYVVSQLASPNQEFRPSAEIRISEQASKLNFSKGWDSCWVPRWIQSQEKVLRQPMTGKVFQGISIRNSSPALRPAPLKLMLSSLVLGCSRSTFLAAETSRSPSVPPVMGKPAKGRQFAQRSVPHGGTEPH